MVYPRSYFVLFEFHASLEDLSRPLILLPLLLQSISRLATDEDEDEDDGGGGSNSPTLA